MDINDVMAEIEDTGRTHINSVNISEEELARDWKPLTEEDKKWWRDRDVAV